MDAAQELAALREISSQIDAAILLDGETEVVASTIAEPARAERLARAARQLLEAADSARPSGEPLTQLEVATLDGSVFLVRDGSRLIAATTSPEPTVGLVFYDLKTCLRKVTAAEQEGAVAEERPKRQRRRRNGNGDQGQADGQA
jgi:predicted regulator of Ras-like GTPase activity (Roadblock/LC7/MglB family)